MAPSSKESAVRRGVFPKLKRVVANAPFAEDVAAAYFCAFDPATPMRAKGILLGALAYFILPVDLVPDMALGLGFTDDIAVLLAAVNAVSSHLRPDHRVSARAALDRLRQGETVTI